MLTCLSVPWTNCWEGVARMAEYIDSDDVLKSLSLQFYKHRMAAGLSRERMAERIGVALSSYRNWENGTVAPNAIALWRIADVCGCSVDELLGRGETE